MGCAITKAEVITDNTGVHHTIPVVVTDQGVLRPLVEYLVAIMLSRSISYMKKAAQAVAMLLRYLDANPEMYGDPQRLVRTFVQRLYSGTVGADGSDPSQLFWLPRTNRTSADLLGVLDNFFSWMEAEYGTAHPNPLRSATPYDERLAIAAWHHRRQHSLTGHAWNRGTATQAARYLRSVTAHRVPDQPPDRSWLRFPEDRIEQLLFRGFVWPGHAHDPDIGARCCLRNILITMLMHYGGLRVSECFHVWVQDVQVVPHDPTTALVRIPHPVDGKAPLDWKDERGQPRKCTRAAYLLGRYGVRPRNLVMGSRGAGWKNPALDEQECVRVYWWPQAAGRWWLQLWTRYLAQIQGMPDAHPYAWVNLERGERGAPYTIDAYDAAYRVALNRIGLEPSKANGLSPHAHRHAYKWRLAQAGFDKLSIAKMLHHRAVASQDEYALPSIGEVTALMNTLEAKLRGARGDSSHPLSTRGAWGSGSGLPPGD